MAEFSVAYWQTKEAKIKIVYPWVIVLCYFILLVVSITAFIQVVLIRKRKEYFIVLTLSCYIVFSFVITTTLILSLASE